MAAVTGLVVAAGAGMLSLLIAVLEPPSVLRGLPLLAVGLVLACVAGGWRVR